MTKKANSKRKQPDDSSGFGAGKVLSFIFLTLIPAAFAYYCVFPLIEVELKADSFDSKKPFTRPLEIKNGSIFDATQIKYSCNVLSSQTNKHISFKNIYVEDNQTPIPTFLELKKLPRGKSTTAFCPFPTEGIEIKTAKLNFIIEYNYLFFRHSEVFGYAINQDKEGNYIWTAREASEK